MTIYDELGEIAYTLKGIGKTEQYEKILETKNKILEMQKRITELENKNKKIEEKIKSLEKVKSQFFLQTQHDLKTPLTSIRGYCDLLIEGIFGKQPKKTLEILEKIEKVIDNKIKNINDLLDANRP